MTSAVDCHNSQVPLKCTQQVYDNRTLLMTICAETTNSPSTLQITDINLHKFTPQTFTLNDLSIKVLLSVHISCMTIELY